MNKKFSFSIISSILALSVALSGTASVLALDEALDPTFGNGGKVITVFSDNWDVSRAVVVQPDGKIIVGGEAWNGSDADFALARYNNDGSQDVTFDADGKVITDFGNRTDSGIAMVLQPDGKIILTGVINDSFGMAPYNNDGSLDITFGTNGMVSADFGGGIDVGTAIAIQPDGKIVAAGFGNNGSSFDVALARYNPDGSLDTSFYTDGIVTTDFGNQDYGYGISIQPDGKLVVAGTTFNIDTSDGIVARYNSDGSLDTTFDSDGKVIADLGGTQDAVNAATLQPDGKIIVAGWSGENASTIPLTFALARFNSDGSLDTSFDTDGRVTTSFDSTDAGSSAVTIQGDGKIVAAGSSSDITNTDFAIARYNNDGSLDTSFATDGKATTDFGNSSESVSGIAIQPDGRIVVTGGIIPDSGFPDFGLARYDPTPVIDVSVDIKPGRFPNRIELEKNICKDKRDDDNLYVAILTTPNFDAQTVDVASLKLGDPLLGATVTPIRSRLSDIDLDGDQDMALSFPLCALVKGAALNASTSQLVLTGRTVNGSNVRGLDSILVKTDEESPERIPVFVYPVNGQTLDYEGAYLFKVRPIPAAEGFLWGFFQNGVMVWENYRDEGTLSGNEYGIHPGSIAHSKFTPGEVEVWVRASINGQWTEATVITIHLQPRSP